MLPDYRKIREKINDFYFFIIEEEKKHQLGFMSEVKSSRVFEGKTIELKRQDGEIDITEIKTFKTFFNIENHEIEKLMFNDIIERVKNAAKDMCKQYFEYFMGIMDSAITKVGNQIDMQGKSITPEHLMKMYDKLFMDFDYNLQPTKKVILTNKQGQEQIIKAFEEIEKDPVLRKKMDEIIEKKRKEYLEREDNRELVG